MNERICIIGGGHSSGKLIKNLLDNNYKGEISIFSEEKYSPYERPPLSKEYLKDEVEIKDFQIDFDSKRKNINLFLNSKIDKINLETKIISDINDKKHKYDKIVFANGSKPKKINNNLEGICYLRNINDSEFIKKRLHDSEDIAILGAGYIGLEVASSIIEKFPQKKITIIESSNDILSRNSNIHLRKIIKEKILKNNIKLFLNSEIQEINGQNKIDSILLKNGKKISCSLLIVGIGVTPNIDIIKNSKIVNAKGIITNEYCKTEIKDTYAIGDITNFKSLFFKNFVKEESWNNAEKQAFVLAQNLLGNNTKYEEIPWFWTNQFDNNYQILGDISNFDKHISRIYNQDKITNFYIRDNKITGILAINTGRDISIMRKVLKYTNEVNLELIKNINIDLRNLLKNG